MKILAIETSCDDTGIAILEITGTKTPKFNVLSNIVSSQQIHQNYGGVFPMMAKREHQRNLVPVLREALQKAKLLKSQKSKIKNQKFNSKFKIIEKILEKENNLYEKIVEFLQTYQKPNIDAIAITYGPGLEPCLWVGVNFAKALSYIWEIPIIPINHIEAHILVNFIKHGTWNMEQIFPAIALVVSGGHTQLILVKKIGKYEIIGETRDDAAGECFDKAAKILGLGYPGGPEIARIAAQYKSENQKPLYYKTDGRQVLSIHDISLPRPMINSKDYDFSFSGLKTAVLYKVKDHQKIQSRGLNHGTEEKFVEEMCIEVQNAICDVLIKKTLQATKDYKAKTIILGGGVSANQELRKQFTAKAKEISSPNSHGRENQGIKVIFPNPALSTDNGLMIAVAGYFNCTKKIAPPSHKASGGVAWQKLSANANLRI